MKKINENKKIAVQTPNPLENMDIVKQICSFLEPETLLSLSRVSKDWDKEIIPIFKKIFQAKPRYNLYRGFLLY